MTDKQKAEEICKRHIFDSNHFDCCMEMAEWKDNKFYRILACIKVSLEKVGLDADKFIDEIKKQWEE